jgi:hypothetical protein
MTERVPPTTIELDHSPRPPGPFERRAATPRGRALLATGGALLTLFLGITLWLFGSTPPEIERPAGIESLPSIDGTLLVVESDRLVLDAFTQLDGDDELEFTIRPEDASHFDLAHLRSHSSIALPTRLYYERDGDTLYAVYKEDAPANSKDDTR